MMAEPLLSAKQLADFLGVNVDTVYQMAQTGVIPVAFRAGPRLRFDRVAVLAAQEAGRVDTSPIAETGSGSGSPRRGGSALDTPGTPGA